jgi:hypothetical protein
MNDELWKGALVATFKALSQCLPSRDSSVGTATGWMTGVRRQEILSALQRPDRLRIPPSILYNQYRESLSPGVKR